MRQLGAELFRTDRQTHVQTDGRTDTHTNGRTDMQTDSQVGHRPNGRFRNFANAHKNRLNAAYAGTLTSGV